MNQQFVYLPLQVSPPSGSQIRGMPMRRADFGRWISAIAGALFATLIFGVNLAQALPDNEVPDNEEVVAETPDSGGDSLSMEAEATQVQPSTGPSLVVCLAGCVNQPGDVVFSETARTPEMASVPQVAR
jgi:hypothetical protein